MMQNGKIAAAARLAGGLALLAVALLGAVRAEAQQGAGQTDGALEITVAGGQFQPLPLALTAFQTGDPSLADTAGDMVAVIEANLERSGLFKLIPPAAFIAGPADFDTAPVYADWRAINADALVTGSVELAEDGRLLVRFRVFDTDAEAQI